MEGATGGSPAPSQATVPCLRSPPLNACSSHAAHADSTLPTLLRLSSGRHCSSSSAAMIARTLMGSFYTITCDADDAALRLRRDRSAAQGASRATFGGRDAGLCAQAQCACGL